MSAALIEVHLAQVSNRLNEIMKVLTIVAAVFTPLTFIAGVYGMNFKHMPELEWYLGYPLAIAFMAPVGFGAIAYFWHRGWIGDGWMKRQNVQSSREPT
jgi:magnesium transporter